MIVLGCDVGAKTGLAILDCSGPRPRHVASCSVAADLVGVLDALLDGLNVTVVGIETPTQVFEHGRARLSKGARIGIERALLAATPMVGVVRAVVQLKSAAAVYEGQAHECRKAVIGRLPKAGVDAAVKAFVLRVVEGWPARSNDHERDAAVAALFAARRHRMPVGLAAKRRRAA